MLVFSDLTIITTTFERPACLDRLLTSIKEHFPSCPVIVGDNSRTPQVNHKATDYLKLPYDCGLSASRNACLQRVQTPYVCLMDDDFIVDRKGGLPILFKAVIDGKADLAGGNFRAKPGKQPSWRAWHGLMKVEGQRLVLKRGKHKQQGRYIWVDLTHNYWVARTAAVKKIAGWENRLKLQEHLDFFLRFKRAGFKVVYVQGCAVLHDPVKTPENVKGRDRDFRRVFLQKWGLESIDYWGRIYPRDFVK